MHRKENHTSLKKSKKSSEERLYKGLESTLNQQNWTVCALATLSSREAGKVSVHMIWHTAGRKYPVFSTPSSGEKLKNQGMMSHY